MNPDHVVQGGTDIDSDALSTWEWEGGFVDLRFDDPVREDTAETSSVLADDVITPHE